eukprot:scaffold116623_cov69-Phaeocystis_antarctica.AAC.2
MPGQRGSEHPVHGARSCPGHTFAVADERKQSQTLTALQSGSEDPSRAPTKAAHPAHPSSAECGGVPRIVGRATCTQAAGPVRVKASLQPRSTWLAPGCAGAEVGRPAASSWAAFCLGRTSRLG